MREKLLKVYSIKGSSDVRRQIFTHVYVKFASVEYRIYNFIDSKITNHLPQKDVEPVA